MNFIALQKLFYRRDVFFIQLVITGTTMYFCFIHDWVFTWDRSMRRRRRRRHSYSLYDFGRTAHSQLIAYRNFSKFSCLHVDLQERAISHTHKHSHKNLNVCVYIETATNQPASQSTVRQTKCNSLLTCTRTHTTIKSRANINKVQRNAVMAHTSKQASRTQQRIKREKGEPTIHTFKWLQNRRLHVFSRYHSIKQWSAMYFLFLSFYWFSPIQLHLYAKPSKIENEPSIRSIDQTRSKVSETDDDQRKHTHTFIIANFNSI